MPGPPPSETHLPTVNGGYQQYTAAGKLKGASVVITGGDSGIGRSAGIMFAMEGADVFFTYLPQEEKDGQETKTKIEKHGGKCHLLATDLRGKDACKKTIDEAMSKMGKIDVLFNNHAVQQTINDIHELTEYVQYLPEPADRLLN